MSNRPNRIEVPVALNYANIIIEVSDILNKIAESRFDGQNTKHVNDMQPETDFRQDNDLVKSFFDTAICNVIKRIGPYVNCGEWNETTSCYDLNLSFPPRWNETRRQVLENSIKNYIVYHIIWQWLEKVSIEDAPIYKAKADELLRDVKAACESRHGKVHYGWNTTY